MLTYADVCYLLQKRLSSRSYTAAHRAEVYAAAYMNLLYHACVSICQHTSAYVSILQLITPKWILAPI
jgi:hypothetical protein